MKRVGTWCGRTDGGGNIVETGADGHMIEEYIVVEHIAKSIC